MSRAVMQQALEALENDAMQRTYAGGVRITNAAIALRAALAEQDSVAAWENKYEMKEWQVHAIRAGWMPAPTPRRPLTEGEMPTLFVGGLALNSEATTEIVRAVEKAHGIGEQHE